MIFARGVRYRAVGRVQWHSNSPASVVRTLLTPLLQPGLVDITGDEAHHALHVLRLRPGDTVRLADGAGHDAYSQVVKTGRHHLSVQVDSVNAVPPCSMALVTVALAPVKGDRWGSAVRGLTELGVGTIRQLTCERNSVCSEMDYRTWRIAAEALKQCRRGWMPQLLPPISIEELASLAANRDDGGIRVVFGDLSGGQAHPSSSGRRTVLAVGPEGGLCDRERAALIAAGAEPVRIASPVLRVETAAVALASLWAASWVHST